MKEAIIRFGDIIWPYLVIAFFAVGLIAFIVMPKCHTCWHPSHKEQRCNAFVRDLPGKCLCREDK